METITLPKEVFDKILTDAEILIDDVEVAFDLKVQKRISDIETGKVKGKNEKELHDYLRSRGVKIE